MLDLATNGWPAQEEMLKCGVQVDVATYNSAVNSCRAILRTLQTQSSKLPDRPDPRKRRRSLRSMRSKRKLV